ncbi:glycosyltransferase [Patescibacteria group bacterium]|nr:MAG: glycosyltransferase [Patescibacteria group bacterium]
MSKVLIFSQDVIGKTMAGPGIRYWEFAKALSANHQVTLAAPNHPDVTGEGFKIVSYNNKAIGKFLDGYDVIISQSISPTMAYLARRNNTRVILDYYDPILLEGLEIYKHQPMQTQANKNSRFLAELQLSLQFADSVICASQKQRDLWLGSLMGLGRLTPDAYAQDVSLNRLIDVVPFGLQDDEPKKTGEGFRKKLGIAKDDTVLLWGGGIWNWFDPLTLIKAVHQVSQKRDDIKLVFMGLKHPNSDVPEMEMATEAVNLAKELDLYDKQVFFNYGWVPYGERQNHFLEADIGVSTHFNHVETRFSFRTRVLDYFWTELPIIATEGDSMAELIAARNLGITVPYENIDALAEAIIKLADDKKFAKEIKNNIKQIREEYRWQKVVSPIRSMIEHPHARKKITYAEFKHILAIYRHTLKDIKDAKGVWPVMTNVASKAYKITFKRS